MVETTKALATPRKMPDDPHGSRDPQVENHSFKQIGPLVNKLVVKLPSDQSQSNHSSLNNTLSLNDYFKFMSREIDVRHTHTQF